MSVESFMRKYAKVTEPYFFYGGSVELRYAPKEHVYYLVTETGELEVQDGVTNVCHIIDKSEALIPWACKMMAAKLLSTAPIIKNQTTGSQMLIMSGEEFEKIVLESKGAHKEKLEEAGNVGHIAHAWIEQYIKSVLADDEPRKLELLAKFPEDERARNCCLAALDWMQQHNVRWLGTERKVYSRMYKYAGTMDGLCKIDSCGDAKCCPHFYTDRLSIADWKSSNYLYMEYLLQTAAYMQAYIEEMCVVDPHGPLVTDRWVIRLGKEDGEFDPWHAEWDAFKEDFDGFLLALKLGRSVRSIKGRIKAKDDAARDLAKAVKKAAKDAREEAEAAAKALAKAEKQQAQEEALRFACKGSEKYKGVRPPRCNEGTPCKSCLAKYAARHPEVEVIDPRAFTIVRTPQLLLGTGD